MAQQILLRRDTAAQWAAVNPTLAEGEIGVETDTVKLKVGTGLVAWNSLPYVSGGEGAAIHGLLLNLDADDHAQYHTDARGDARYVGLSDARLTDARPPTAHAATHAAAGADALTPSAIGAATSAQGALADTAVQPATLSGYVTTSDARLTDARTPLAHDQAASTITGLATVATSGAYADLSGQPSIPTTPADIGAAAATADLADFTSGTATSGQVPTADGAGGVAWAASSGGTLDLAAAHAVALSF